MLILNTVGDTIQAEGSAASALTVTLYGTETVAGVDTYKRLGQMTLTGAGTQDVVYTVPAATSTIVAMVVIANLGSTVRTINLWNVPFGGGFGDGNVILKNVSILGDSSLVWNRGMASVIPVQQITGASGYSGISGYSGYSGISGYSGYSGESGYSGYSGESGYSGYTGVSGYSGYTGVSGYSGYSAEMVLTPAPADVSGSGLTATMTVDAGAAATAVGQAYKVDTDGELICADADAAATMPCMSLALETGTGSKRVLLKGFIRNDTAWNWTVGGIIYVSTDPSTTTGLTQTAPSGSGDQVQAVGVATHADRIWFDPSLVLVQVV